MMLVDALARVIAKAVQREDPFLAAAAYAATGEEDRGRLEPVLLASYRLKRQFAEAPPEADWAGVVTLTSK